MSATEASNPDPALARTLTELGSSFGSIHEQISGEVPKSAHCVLAGNVLTCVLNGSLSKLEQLLIAHDQIAQVRKYREILIEVESDRFREAVTATLGREVSAAVHVFEPGDAITTLVYVLHPAATGPDERTAILAWAAQVRRQSQHSRSQLVQLREAQHDLAAAVERTRQSSPRRRPIGEVDSDQD